MQRSNAAAKIRIYKKAGVGHSSPRAWLPFNQIKADLYPQCHFPALILYPRLTISENLSLSLCFSYPATECLQLSWVNNSKELPLTDFLRNITLDPFRQICFLEYEQLGPDSDTWLKCPYLKMTYIFLLPVFCVLTMYVFFHPALSDTVCSVI